MAKNERGFGAVEVLLIVVFIALIGVGGWWVWQKNQDASKPASNTNTSAAPSTGNQGTSTPQKNTLSVTSDVTAEVPEGWVVQKQPADCPEFITRVECVSGAEVSPKDAPKNLSGEPFSVLVKVYKAAGATSAKSWFINTMEMGSPASNDQTSTDKINGYDTYYFKQNDTSYSQVNYLFLKGDVVVLVEARLTEKHFASDGSGKVDGQKDFTAYTDAVASFAKSIIIK